MNFLLEAMNAVSGEEFDEIPVSIEEFVESPEYLSTERQYKLSEHQYNLVKAVSQIYKYETLVHLHGQAKADIIWAHTYREVIMQLGKGSGKDFSSTVAVAYIVYLCLCLKNPTKYFNNASIDIINIAINADQAQRVFFKNFMKLIKESAWFTKDKYDDKRDHVEFDKGVNVYSGHSEREAYEGYNTLVIVLDEISGFALESASGNAKAKTAPEIYDWARGSVDSRFAELGKVVMLSFPRFRDDFIQQKYNENVLEKEVIERSARVKINPELPDGYEDNEFEIKWEEDHIIRTFPYVFALKRPSWEVNPTKELQKDYALAFYRNYADALGRFACMPSDSTEDTLIKDKSVLDTSFITVNPIDNYGVFASNFIPHKDKEYYVHVDLAKVHDRCAVALAHIDRWVVPEGNPYADSYPVVRVDAVRWWEPSKENPMNYAEVTNYIMELRRRGFNIRRVTFDRWQSQDSMNLLRNVGMEVELLSVDTPHYDTFLDVLYGDRLLAPKIEELVDELRQLRRMQKGSKVVIEHPRNGYKDLSDATCGAIFNAVSLSTKPRNKEVEILTYRKVLQAEAEEQAARQPDDGVIRAPKKEMPADLAEQFDKISLEAIRII